MKGQWIGDYTGTNTGTIIVNVDELPSHFQGVAYLKDNNPLLPGTGVGFKTKDKNSPGEIQTSEIFPIDPQTGVVSSWAQVKHLYCQNVRIPTSAQVKVVFGSDCLKLSWTTDVGTSAECTLPRSKAEESSDIVAKEMDWEAYKKYVATLEGRNFVFRGQNERWRLRTAFHRTGRADLTRFLREDVQVLHRHLSARTKHVFNLQIPEQNGAFLHMVQHHGYPTPLLDWSYSPYVAAFFAYRGISNIKAAESSVDAKVRVHVFNHAQWKSDLNQLVMLLTTSPHLSICEFMAIENERMIPQQALSTITNLDDIETYVRSKEAEDKKYLWAIDLPVKERRRIVQELSFMGITAGALFPGLDGACEELRERNFGI
jgi:hypothetical protein